MRPRDRVAGAGPSRFPPSGAASGRTWNARPTQQASATGIGMTTNPQPEGGMPLAVTYDDQKCLARSGSRDERCALAGRADIRPEILYYLAGAAEAAVRRHIARNDVTPRHADLLLSRDEDDRVRSEVAGKIAQAVAPMVADEGDRKSVGEGKRVGG